MLWKCRLPVVIGALRVKFIELATILVKSAIQYIKQKQRLNLLFRNNAFTISNIFVWKAKAWLGYLSAQYHVKFSFRYSVIRSLLYISWDSMKQQALFRIGFCFHAVIGNWSLQYGFDKSVFDTEENLANELPCNCPETKLMNLRKRVFELDVFQNGKLACLHAVQINHYTIIMK